MLRADASLAALLCAIVLTAANASKPLVIDDPVYVAYARQIEQHPGDPYGFELYWYDAPEPAMGIGTVPAVLPYWLAGAMRLLGDSPIAWKLSLLPFALALTGSLAFLLGRFAQPFAKPVLWALALGPAVLPGFSLMLDVPALALGLLGFALCVRACELGRTLLEKEMRRAGLSLPRALERGELDEIARVRARGGVDDLLAAVGYGKVPAATVVRGLRPDWQPEAEPEAARPARPPRAPKMLRDLFRRSPRSSSTGIRVEGQGDVLVRFANCCAPIPGDDVVGFVTRGRGITVHQKDCRVVFHLDKQRRVEVDWDPEAQVARRIRMKVTSRDEPGLLAKVTKTISAAGINIGAARVSTHPDRTATQSFDLWVADVRTLASVMKEIERIKGILSVERVRG